MLGMLRRESLVQLCILKHGDFRTKQIGLRIGRDE